MSAAYYVKQIDNKAQLYRSPDPNNKTWSNDKSRFGFKMLQSMGWDEGKGLGKNEDGSRKYIRVKKNYNNLGIGEHKKSSENWLKGNAEFSDILKKLNEANNKNNDEKKEKKKKRKRKFSEIDEDESEEEDLLPPKKKKKLNDSKTSDKKKKKKDKKKKKKKKDKIKKSKGSHLLYSKRLRSKNIKNFSSSDINKVLGIDNEENNEDKSEPAKPNVHSDIISFADLSNSTTGLGFNKEGPEDEFLEKLIPTVSHSTSIDDYFKKKKQLKEQTLKGKKGQEEIMIKDEDEDIKDVDDTEENQIVEKKEKTKKKKNKEKKKKSSKKKKAKKAKKDSSKKAKKNSSKSKKKKKSKDQ
eukprot:TRINITY_DN1663_c0_g1_i4.p1 TRINITY_DN1663_c0_g1~~TRINITY_DN1663_c0_g1_i4.p1  ORF type:complete len:354 (-),score=157.19 TRINITY_DN1663_c0_g1_i4:241-1302(-)